MCVLIAERWGAQGVTPRQDGPEAKSGLLVAKHDFHYRPCA